MKKYSVAEVQRYCMEAKEVYLELCRDLSTPRVALNVQYIRGISEHVCILLKDFAEIIEQLAQVYRTCLLKFAPFEIDIYGVNAYLMSGLNEKVLKSSETYVKSCIGSELLNDYRILYSKFMTIRKTTEKRLIKFALTGADSPVILYDEVLNVALKSSMYRKNSNFTKVVDSVIYQNELFLIRGCASESTVGVYFFKG